jgi:hypothetical protein
MDHLDAYLQALSDSRCTILTETGWALAGTGLYVLPFTGPKGGVWIGWLEQGSASWTAGFYNNSRRSLVRHVDGRTPSDTLQLIRNHLRELLL